MTERITVDSFGTEVPVNWPQIAEWFNNQVEEKELTNEQLDELWEAYWAGECSDAPEAITDAPTVQFESGTSNHSGAGVNYLLDKLGDIILYAETEVPDGASDDYGYMSLKESIIEQAKAAGLDPSMLHFWYDGQEQYLADDAYTNCETKKW